VINQIVGIYSYFYIVIFERSDPKNRILIMKVKLDRDV